MKKINPKIKSRFLSFLSFQVLFVLITSLIINPAAVLGANKARLSTKVENKQSPITKQTDGLIPSVVFSNPAPINVPDAPGMATSTISVSGTSGPISTITLSLTGLSVGQTRDLDMLLVGPGGQNFHFLSDVGGLFDTTTNVNLTLSDAAGSSLPSTGSLTSGAFRPTNYASGTDTNFPPPAPPTPYNDAAPQGSSTFASIYGGLSGASVNGTWTLYIRDDQGGGTLATVSGGWALDITTTAAAPTTTVLSSSLNPSNTNQAVTFTATVTSTSTVNTGTVTFVDTTTSVTLCNNVAVNGSGVATCLVPANTLTERRHTIQATYNANPTFATSNASIVQTVNTPTVISGPGNTVFTNPGGLTIPDAPGTSIPYPSNIQVSGLSGSISKVTLTLTNATFPVTNHFNFLLVGPGGQTFVFMSDAGGAVASNNVTLTFDDAAGSLLPNSGAITSGTYRPTDYAADTENFPAPAPSAPYNTAAPNGVGTFASIFGGAAPNGTWSLYPIDDSGGGANGTIGSWSLTFITSGDSPTTTTLTSNPNPATTTQTVLFTATVTSATTVNVGTVTFRRGATVLCATVPVNASGVATCSAGPFAQGDFVATADYNGSPGQFNISSGNLTQQVNSPTVITGNNYANSGGITIPNSSIANPYPSRIIVTGLGGAITKVTATLNGVTTPTPEDVDFLLVGPGGQKFQMMGDAGGANALTNVNITLDDAAPTALPDATAITSGTYRPASYSGSDTFPAPAPPGPYNPAAPDGAGTFANVFNGANANGTWSLYAIEDSGDAVNTTLSGWSLTFTLAPASTTTAVSSSANPSVFGQPVTFTATVSTTGLGTPSGNVQFFDGATPIGGAVALNGSGQAQITTSSLSVGNHTISAQYAGASTAGGGGFTTSTGNLTGNPQVVNKANTTSTLSSPTNPSATGQSITFTATVNPVAPGAGTRTGTVNISRNGQVICNNVTINAGGQATCSIRFTIAGNYNITASYSGDTNFNASNSATFVQQVLGPTAANVTVSGRIMSEDGRAVYGARIVVTDSSGQSRLALTNPFGYYRFDAMPSGATYTFTVSAKGYQTQQIVRSITDEVNDLDISLQRE